MSIRLEHEGLVSRIILDNPPQNLLDIDALDAVVAAHQEADAHPKSRVILTTSAVPAMFSNGLDPAYVLAMPADQRITVFQAVGRVIHGLISLGKPQICLVNGPAMAGGAIIAITADFRVFDAEHGRLSFSEPKVGLPIPPPLVEVIRLFCDPAHLRNVVLMGKNMDARSAMSAGLADASASGDALADVVAKMVQRLARLSPAVMAATKRGMRQHLYDSTATLARRDSQFLDFVGDEFLGEGLRALVEERFARFDR